MASFLPVIALTRGLDVLRVVNATRNATVADIHRQTGLHRATVVRMLETLEHAGYVMRRDGGKKYMPTGRVLLLANGFQAHDRVAQLAEPVLVELRQRIGWPSDVAIPDRDAMMIAATSRAFDNLLLNRRSGTRAPMLSSALGRAYVAACSTPRLEEILGCLARSSEPFDRIATDRAAVDRILQETRRRGYGTPDEAYSKAVYQSATSGFAVPVLANQEPVGSINLMFLTSTIRLQDAVTNFLPTLRRAAERIGKAMESDLADRANQGTK
ncbi:helix-turn-helix domain-containing protein [Vineibacter terrae]|uniref:helix-turn-helix domain-containing protein n=1 Tax=Vineibacter terrae TaxID=2586908 RepID=UPI002E3467AE|nr:helix-turn-helix domain-containing protein [Vineibacter terrae]HEX2884952.1 helix-turn-helix domain-containing protein [Vineibacter terrae]